MEMKSPELLLIHRDMGHFIVPSVGSVEDLMEMWMKLTNAGRVTMFNVFFMQVVARPEGKNVEEIKISYDKTWGKISFSLMNSLKLGIQEILHVKTLPEVFQRLGVSIEPEGIAELILWAIDNKHEGHKYYPPLPKTGGERVERWKSRHVLFRAIQESPIPVVEFVPPTRTRR